MLDFESFLDSDIFTFHVGSTGEAVAVHSAVIARTSEALNALINGNMAEARQRSAVLDDIEKPDFLAFCEFAYRGDYPSLSTCIEEYDPSLAALEDIQNSKSDVSLHRRRRFLDSKHKPRNYLREKFNSTRYCGTTPRLHYLQWCESQVAAISPEDLASMLLIHARLYSFADKYDVNNLKILTLHKLHRALVASTALLREQVGVITTLVRCAYQHTPEPDTTQDKLRELVSKYVACNLQHISASDEFLELMADCGSFAKDIWKIVQHNCLREEFRFSTSHYGH